jgi:hypothetical protein
MNRWGLGPGLDDDSNYFGHGGSNEGFRCRLVMLFNGNGAAIMTNSDNGTALVDEILITLSHQYGWSAFEPMERTVADIGEGIMSEIAGTYRVFSETDATIEFTDGRLYLEATELGRHELLPESENVFFSREVGFNVNVLREDGRVVAIEALGRRAERTGPPQD